MPFYPHPNVNCPECGELMRHAKGATFECTNPRCRVIRVHVNNVGEDPKIDNIVVDPTMERNVNGENT